MEREEDWEAYRDGIFQDLKPVGQLEFVLAERAALNFWRMGRVTRFEVASIAEAIRDSRDRRSRSRRVDSAEARFAKLVKQLHSVEKLSAIPQISMVDTPDGVAAIEAACVIVGVDPDDPTLLHIRRIRDGECNPSG